MQSVIYKMEDVIPRKEYLKNKEKQKRKNKRMLKNKKPPYILMVVIFVLSVYILKQFSTYKEKYFLVNNVPVEISSLKNYDVYYTTKTYTYDPETNLNYIKTNNSNVETILTAKGITNLIGTKDYIYGIENGKLIRIKNNINKINKLKNVGKTIENTDKFGDVETIIDKGVVSYYIYKEDVYVHLKGSGIETGIYSVNQETKKHIKTISGDISQMLVDENNIYIVKNEADKNIYKYSKDGTDELKMTKNRSVKYLIESENKIFFIDELSKSKILSIDKYTLKEMLVSKDGAININNDKKYIDGRSYMGIYNNELYYINTNKENNIFKVKTDGSFEEKQIIKANVEKISIIGSYITYKEKNGKAIYRYEIEKKVSSELISGRIIDFVTNVSVK